MQGQTVSSELKAECEAIRDLLLNNIYAIRHGASFASSGGSSGVSATTSIQLIARKIFLITLKPRAFALLFDLLQEAIEADMVENFTMPILTGKFSEYPADTPRRIRQMRDERLRKQQSKNATCSSAAEVAGGEEQEEGADNNNPYKLFTYLHEPPQGIEIKNVKLSYELLSEEDKKANKLKVRGSKAARAAQELENQPKASSRQVFPFIATFSRSFSSVIKSIRFSVQYLDSAYGVRCRNFTLCDYAFRVIEKCFWAVRSSLYETLFQYLDEIRIGGCHGGAVGGEISNFRDIKAVVDFIVTMSEKNFDPNLHTASGSTSKVRDGASMWHDFLEKNLLSARRCYGSIAASRLAAVSTSGSGGAHQWGSIGGGEAGIQQYARWAAAQIEAERSLQRALIGGADSNGGGSGEALATSSSITSSARLTLSELRQWRSMRLVLFEVLVKPIYNIFEDTENTILSRELELGNDLTDLFTLLESASSDENPLGGVVKLASVLETYIKQKMKEMMNKSDENTASSPLDPAPRPNLPAAAAQQALEAQRLQQAAKNYNEVVDWVHTFLHVTWPRQFKRNNIIGNALANGLRAALRDFEDVPRFHSDVVDAFMRKVNEDEAVANEASIFTFVRIFESILQKDEFLTFYKSRLASRLLRPSGFSFANENGFIRGVRSIVGNNDTFHFTSMIGDVQSSKTLSATFIEMVWGPFWQAVEKEAAEMIAASSTQSSSTKKTLHDVFNAGRPIKLSFVLAASQYWPAFDRQHFDEAMALAQPGAAGITKIGGSIPRLCPSIGEVLSRFQAYYASRHHTRRIRWSPMQSTAAVAVLFNKTIGVRTIEGTLAQAAILLGIDQYQYEEAKKKQEASEEVTPTARCGLSPAQLALLTGLPSDTIRDTLASMTFDLRANVLVNFDPATGAAVQHKVIKEDTPHFSINTTNFRTQFKRVELPKPRTAKNVVSASDRQRNLQEMRNIAAQIAVIRFMKSRGTAAFANMVSAVLTDLRVKFDAQPSLVKQSLDFLIDKEYVRRDENDFNTLIYIA